jgi:hypothetical protein
MSEEEHKYTIIYDEWSCTSWGFEIDGVWRGAERDEGVKSPEEDDELLDYTLAKLKEHIKKGYTDFKSVMDCFQTDDFISDEGYCDTCGHSGHKTIWKI